MNHLKNALLVSSFLWLEVFTPGHANPPAPEMGTAETLELSKKFPAAVTALKPDRQARASDVSRDGTRILEAYQGGASVHLFDNQGQELATAFPDVPAQLVMMGSGNKPVAVLENNDILVWPRGLQGKPVKLTVPGYEAMVVYPLQTRINPIAIGDTTVATGTWRKGRGIRDIATGEKMSDMTYATTGFDALKISPDGNKLAAIQGSDLVVYRLPDGAFLGHYNNADAFDDTGSSTINDAVFSPDSKRIHILGQGHWWHVMDIATNAISKMPSVREARRLAISPDNRFAVFDTGEIGTLSGTAETRQTVLTEYIDRSSYFLTSPTCAPDAEKVAFYVSVGYVPDGEEATPRLLIWNAKEDAVVMDYRLPVSAIPDKTINLDPKLAFSPDGNTLVLSFANGNAYLFPASKDALLQQAK